MEVHQLRYILAIAEAGNFTRAAARCFVAQPSLSQQVAKLEDELGHKLFHRLGRRAVPTDAGRLFLERARRILAEIDDAVKAVRDDPQLGGTISVGAIPTLAPYLLPGLIARCRRAMPNLQVFVREGFRADLVDSLLRGELDAALISLPLEDRRLSIQTIHSEPLLLAVARQHPLAQLPRVTAADLAGQTFVMLGDSSSLAQQIQGFCGLSDISPRIDYRCVQVATLKSLVKLGLGITILPRVSRHVTDGEDLVYRELSGRAPKREIAVVRHLQRYQSRGVEQFLALVREEIRAIARTGDA